MLNLPVNELLKSPNICPQVMNECKVAFLTHNVVIKRCQKLRVLKSNQIKSNLFATQANIGYSISNVSTGHAGINLH